ncbi:hypothetical protein PGB90_003201 [Kerria lacca]
MKENKQQLILSWKNVTGWTKQTRKTTEKKKLLDNVSGIAKSGFLTAIVSPNGAGKTTLIAVLSKRFKGSLEGEILLNGYEMSQEEMSFISGYACQKDQNYEYLTVNEHLTFVARLKMNPRVSAEVRKKTIARVVEDLLLSHRMDVKIGSLSGGQRKRLTLATQLMTEPKILFCDEPTTGLDSYNAERVVELLRILANDGKMVICTIHQPTSGIFEKFDNVTLLVPGGQLGYHGPVSEINDYFSRLGYVCPENYNLCEYIVSQVTVKTIQFQDSESEEKKVEDLVVSYRNSKIYEELTLELDTILKNKKDSPTFTLKRTSVSLFMEFYLLFWRTLLILKNSYKTNLIRFVSYIFVFSIISWPYGRIKINQEGVMNMIGMLNIFMLQILYSTLSGIVNVVPEEMPIFVLESTDRLYTPFSFYFSKVIILTFKASIESFVYTSYTYTVTGLSNMPIDYVISAIPSTLLCFTAAAYGFFLSAAFNSVSTYSLFSVPFEIISMVFAGLNLRLNSLSPYLAWVKYISFPYYAYEAMNILQWVKHNHICLDPVANGQLTMEERKRCSKDTESSLRISHSPVYDLMKNQKKQHCDKPYDECYKSGDSVLESLGFSRAHLQMDYIGLIVYFCILHILAFIFLIRKLKSSSAY